MSQWTRDTPALGDHAQVASATAVLDDISRTLTDLKTMVSAQTGRISDSTWQGLSGYAFRDRGISIAVELGTFTQWLADTATALSVYAGKLSSLETSERLVRPQLNAARSAAQRATNKLAFATDPVERRNLTATVDREESKVRACQSAWDDLVAERETMNSILRQQLSTAPAVSFMQIGQVMIGAGYSPGKPLRTSDLLDALTSLSEDVLDWDGDPATLSALAELLRYAIINPGLADEYMRELGGTKLAELLYRLDLLNDERFDLRSAIVEVQSRLRTTFSVGSANWDRDTADEFNKALMRGPSAPLVVSYLYYDTINAPMSQAMSQSIADLIRQLEEKDGRPWVWNGGVTAMGSQMDAFIITFNGEQILLADPAHSALIQIAANPGAALEWLTTAGALDFWYRDRDWAHASGATAPTILWAAIQNAPGALIGPECDPDLVERLAQANADIINHWQDTVLKGGVRLDDAGRVALAEILVNQLPYWIETSIWEKSGLDRGAALIVDQSIDWLGLRGTACVISDEALLDLMRLVARSENATMLAISGTEALARVMLAAAAVNSEPGSYERELAKIAAVYGLVDGSGIAHQLSAARYQDAVVQGAIDAASFGAGLMPGGVATSLAVEGSSSLASNTWTNHYDTRLAQLITGSNTDDSALEAARLENLTELANGYIAPTVLETQPDGAQGIANAAIRRYDLNRFLGALS